MVGDVKVWHEGVGLDDGQEVGGKREGSSVF